MDAKTIVEMLLLVLPDSTQSGFEDCFESLYPESQERVKEARQAAEEWLAAETVSR